MKKFLVIDAAIWCAVMAGCMHFGAPALAAFTLGAYAVAIVNCVFIIATVARPL